MEKLQFSQIDVRFFTGKYIFGFKLNQNMEKFEKVKELLASVEADAEKFYSAGNNAAGTRVRKAMQDLKVLAQEIRAEVTDKKNANK